MIECLVDGKLLEKQRAPEMSYGEYWTFKGNTLFGVGQQSVHNAGSSIISDTRNFIPKIIEFINEHIEYNSKEFIEILEMGQEHFYEQQREQLIRFEKDKGFRKTCLQNIFLEPFVFSNKIKCAYFEIALMLYFIKKYNYLLSTRPEHKFTKNKMSEFYSDSNSMLNDVYEKLIQEDDVGYLLDVCYGRYYFLELHFKFHSDTDNTIRKMPKTVINEFFEIGIAKSDLAAFEYEENDSTFQKRINESEGYTKKKDIETANNREPELSGNYNNRYKTNARLAKTVIQNHKYICEIDETHVTFVNTKGKQYMEAHHLLPISSQKDFLPINIDREENIVCICPNCHKAIHHGSDDEKLERLNILYNLRKDKLKQAKIDISRQKLLEIYKINTKDDLNKESE